MTAAAKKRSIRKPLRIREELPPESAKYAAIDRIEYVMIPVADFGNWYEDIEANIIAEERRQFDDGPAIPIEDILAEIRGKKAKKP